MKQIKVRSEMLFEMFETAVIRLHCFNCVLVYEEHRGKPDSVIPTLSKITDCLSALKFAAQKNGRITETPHTFGQYTVYEYDYYVPQKKIVVLKYGKKIFEGSILDYPFNVVENF